MSHCSLVFSCTGSFAKAFVWTLITLSSVFLLPAAYAETTSTQPIELNYRILGEHPHSTQAFTQGLAFTNDVFFESSGLYGQSFVFAYEKLTNKTLHRFDLPRHFFAEGLTVLDERVFVLTWKRGTALVYDRSNFTLKHQFTYEGEGWGLTHDDRYLWMSDGTNRLVARNPDTFAVDKTIDVRLAGEPLTRLNELEFAFGLIWANVWQDDRIFAVSPSTGEVLGVVDLAKLVKQNSVTPGHTVLNGIAFNAQSGTFWVTGKFWPGLYELDIELAELMSKVTP